MGKKQKRAEAETEAETVENDKAENELDVANGDRYKKKRRGRTRNKERNESDKEAKEIPTVSIAVSGSIINNAQSLELATRLAGQIARAATVFRIDEGMLPPLEAPHHLRKHEWAPFREGVTLNEKLSSGETLVDVGLRKSVVVNQALEPGIRVTVAMDQPQFGWWHLLIGFGGLAGLEENIEEDSNLKGKDVREVFDSYLNTCPHQGSRAIRTEEAILISLQYFQEPISRAMQRVSALKLPEVSQDGYSFWSTSKRFKN